MISPALQRLLEHDERHGSEYVHTLSAYLACTGRLRVAAEQLTIHRNTLEYRLRRIEQVAGISLDDSNSRLALELGIRLLEMRSLTSTETPSPLRSVAQRVDIAPQESGSEERTHRIS
jgi:DNA-binding PucR family transcriptional regulator